MNKWTIFTWNNCGASKRKYLWSEEWLIYKAWYCNEYIRARNCYRYEVFLVYNVPLVTNSSLQSNLKIIKTRSGSLRPAPCATICAGETGSNPAFDRISIGTKEFLVLSQVDISECGFVEPPIVSVYREGDAADIAEWTHAVSHVNTKSFMVFITSNTEHTNTSPIWILNVMWTAIGYIC